MFLIFVNDIFNIHLNGAIQLYADNIALTCSCNNVPELQEQMQNDLKSLENYFKTNM